MMEPAAARLRIDSAGRVWVEGLSDQPLRLIPSHPRFRKHACYWRVDGSRRWSLTPALALKSWLAGAENRA